jgi:hypothetical protein
MGSCSNFEGCFASANATGAEFPDTPGICNAMSVNGIPAGPLAIGQSPLPTASLAGLGCVPSPQGTPGVAGTLVANALGLPGPFVQTLRASVEVK